MLDRKIEYVVRDDKLKPREAVKEFRRMVTRDKVDFVMGVISKIGCPWRSLRWQRK